ncbi:MAG: DUF2059 domain-containing protein [Cyanobacteria bacterium J06632_3]
MSFASEVSTEVKQTDVEAVEAESETVEIESEAVDPTLENPASVEQIEELLALTNADDLSIQVMEGLITQFRQLAPEVPDEWWDRFIAKVDDTDFNSLIIPIYERNFTAEEMDGIIAFYRTPVGQSVIAKMPAVTQDSIMVGQTWGVSIAEELMRELEADGYQLSPPAPGASAPASPEPATSETTSQ